MENKKVRIMLLVETDLAEMCQILNGEPLATYEDHLDFLEYVKSNITPGEVYKLLEDVEITVDDVQVEE